MARFALGHHGEAGPKVATPECNLVRSEPAFDRKATVILSRPAINSIGPPIIRTLKKNSKCMRANEYHAL